MIHSVTYAKQKENQQVINFIEINRAENFARSLEGKGGTFF